RNGAKSCQPHRCLRSPSPDPLATPASPTRTGPAARAAVGRLDTPAPHLQKGSTLPGIRISADPGYLRRNALHTPQGRDFALLAGGSGIPQLRRMSNGVASCAVAQAATGRVLAMLFWGENPCNRDSARVA